MNLLYSRHALLRIKQRGISSLEVEYIIQYPQHIKKSMDGTKEAYDEINKLKTSENNLC